MELSETTQPIHRYYLSMPNKSTGTLAERLLLERRAMDLTQDELAARSGVSRPHIANIERGRSRNISTDVVFALAKALDIPVAYLLGISDNPLVPEPEGDSVLAENRVIYEVNHPVVRNLAKKLLDAFVNLSAADQETLLRIATTLRQSETPRTIGTDENQPTS